MKKAVVMGVGLAALSVASWSSAALTPQKLDIREFMFAPRSVTVASGTPVTWVNHDEETHTVTSADGSFASPALEANQTFTHTFTAPGTYTYFCALHPHMRATIVVKGDH